MISILTTYKQAMENAPFRAAAVSIAQDIAARRYNVAIALWRRGFLSAEPLVAEFALAGTLGTHRQADYTSRNPALADVVEQLIAAERNERVAAIADEYDASAATIQKLIDAHSAFAAGTPIDLETLLAQAVELRQISERLKAGVEADRAAAGAQS